MAGDTITLMGVPPGSGFRMSLDRNRDGVLDGDEPPPTLRIARQFDSAVLSWPLSAAGFAPESAESSLQDLWAPVPEPIEIKGDQNYVTNSAAAPSRFFRLRLR